MFDYETFNIQKYNKNLKNCVLFNNLEINIFNRE